MNPRMMAVAGLAGRVHTNASAAAGHGRKRRKSMRPHFGFFAALMLVLLASRAWAQQWSIQTIGPANSGTTLQFDSQGRPQIVYHDGTSGDAIKYAAWTGSAWNITTLTMTGRHPVFVLGADDRPHVAWTTTLPAWQLMYATNNGSGWTTQQVTTKSAEWYKGIALGPDNQPRIIWNQNEYTMGFSTFNGTTWSTTVYPIGGTPIDGLALKVDPNGLNHVAWAAAFMPGGARYMTIDGTTRSSPTLLEGNFDNWYIDIALTHSGQPRMTYYHTAQGLTYASLGSSGWTLTRVDSAGDVGKYPSLALTSDDRPEISYFDVTNGDLKFASFDGTAWSTQTIDSLGTFGWATSLALWQNQPSIAYIDGANHLLKLATIPEPASLGLLALGALPLLRRRRAHNPTPR